MECQHSILLYVANILFELFILIHAFDAVRFFTWTKLDLSKLNFNGVSR